MKIPKLLGRAALALFLMSPFALPSIAYAEDSDDSSDTEASEDSETSNDDTDSDDADSDDLDSENEDSKESENGGIQYADDDTDPDSGFYIYEESGDTIYDPVWRRSDTVVSNYETALSDYNDAVKSGMDEEALAEYENKLEEAERALEEHYQAEGCTVTKSDETHAILVTDEEGKAVTVVGDPVLFSKGLYTTSECDLSIAVGTSVFSVRRNYTSSSSDSTGLQRYGSFGRKWSTNLDCRIIRCRSDFDFWNCEMDYDELSELLESKSDAIRKCADEEGSGSEAEKIAELIEKMDAYIAMHGRLHDLSLKNSASRELGGVTSYGEASISFDKIGPDSLIYVDDSGIPHVLKNDGEGLFVSSSANGKITVEEGEDGFSLFLDDGEERTFDNFGVISSIKRRDGSEVSFTSSGGFVTRATLKSPSGSSRSILVARDSSSIKSISDGVRTVRYGYDGNLLASVTDADGDTRRFEYDDDRITKIVKPDGAFVVIDYETDMVPFTVRRKIEASVGVFGDDEDEAAPEETYEDVVEFKKRYRVVSTTDENGKTERFVYGEDGFSMEYIDRDGSSSFFAYDERGNTVLQRYPDGSSHTFEYDGESRKIRSVGDILSVDYSYDGDGNLVRAAYSDGSEETFVYSDGNMVFKTDRDGVSRSFEYDAFGNLCAMYVGGKKTADLVYEDGLLKKSTDVFGNITLYEYDGYSQMTKKSVFAAGSSAPSAVWTWKYDTAGRVEKTVDGAGVERVYSYGPHLVTVTGSDGLETVSVYSSRKCLLERTVTDLRTGEKRRTHYEYDKALNLISESVSGVGSDGKTVEKTLVASYEYTASGRLRKKVDWNALCPGDVSGGVSGWAFEYALKNGRVSSVVSGFSSAGGDVLPAGSRTVAFDTAFFGDRKVAREVGGDGRVHSSVFDCFGNLLSETVDGNLLTELEYSPAGKILSSSSVSGKFEFAYDPATGRFSGVRECGGAKNSFNKVEYFDNGWKKRVTDRLGNATEYGYDCFGNVRSVKTAKGTCLVERDGAGHVLVEKVVSPSGEVLFRKDVSYSDGFRKVDVFVGGVRIGSSERNAFGNIVSEVDGEGNERRFGYDILGRMVVSVDAAGNSTRFEYNARGELLRTLYPDGSFRKCSYDAFGNCVRVSDSCGEVSWVEYDSSSRVTRRDSRPFSSPEEYSYDYAGRLLSVVKNSVVLERYEYSPDGKTTSIIDSRGNRSVYSTDGFGRVVSEKNRLGYCSSRKFDSEGRISSETDFEGRTSTVERSFNVNGGRHAVRTSFQDGGFSYAEYDAMDRIVLAKNLDSEIRYEYDAFGNLSSLHDVVSGVRVKYSHDRNGRVKRITSQGGIERDLSYSYGKIGETTKIVDSVRTGSLPLVTEINFSYDKLGRETFRRFSSGETLSSSYDKAGRLSLRVGRDCQGSVVFVDGSVYGSDGHLTHSVDSNLDVRCYGYDKDGRISSVSYPYSDSLKKHFEDVFIEATGSSPSAADVSRLALKSADFGKIQDLLSASRVGSLSGFGNTLEESFSYDSEGNLAVRKTPVGKIHYGYDAENRLLAAGSSTSLGGMSIGYDRNGNMTKRVTPSSSCVFEYTAGNRMKRAVVSSVEGGISDISYGYDFFGRRIASGAKSTVFDGFSLRELFTKDSSLAEDYAPQFSSSGRGSGSRSGENSVSASGRYVFIDDEGDVSSSVQISSNAGGSRGGSFASVAPVYASGVSPVSFSSFTDSSSGLSGSSVLMSDLSGSVRAAIGGDGLVASVDYDIFGAGVGSSKTVYSFVGKRFDEHSGTYDFGYRDYMSRFARFTTKDPARDGRNWYSYCAANPVDFFDADGYEKAANNSQSSYANAAGNTEYWMQDEEWGDDPIGGGDRTYVYTDSNGVAHGEFMSNSGCAVTAFAEAASDVYGIDITPDMLNGKAEFFNGDEFDKTAAASALNLGIERSGDGADKAIEFINEKINEEGKEYGLVVKTEIGPNQDSPHFVSVAGLAGEDANGRASVPATATSRNDTSPGYGRAEAGFSNQDGELRAGLCDNSYAYAVSSSCSK